MATRVQDLVSRMTLEEKASQLINTTPAIPRLHIPAYDYWSEGLHGIARSGYATLFPQAIGLAATWDAPLLGHVSTVISTEARAKYAEAIRHDIHSINYGLTIWSPNINIFRDPRWGRGQETYGEDPYLTSQLGVAFVDGLQGGDADYLRTVGTPKHFAVHSGPESTRHKANIDVSPHDLEDTYLPAFRATIRDGHAESVMCSYNAVDGTPACANTMLLDKTLRHDWGFRGYVVSDCDAVSDFYAANGHHFSVDKEHAAAAGVLGGTDLNCGSTYLALPAAVRAGLLPESAVDTSLKRVLTSRMRLGLLSDNAHTPYDDIPFSVVDSRAHRLLALEAARESMVLLKNEGHILPLDSGLHTIAVVGPNAAALAAIEGNYNAIPRNPVLPLDAIRTELAAHRVLYAQGSPWADGVRIVAPRTLFHPAGSPETEGWAAEYFSGTSFSGQPVRRTDAQIDFDWNGAAPVPEVPQSSFSARWSSTITAPAPWSYSFDIRLNHCGGCTHQDTYTVWLDGKTVAQFHDEPGERSHDNSFVLQLADTQPHAIRIEYTHAAPLFGGGLTLEWTAPDDLLRAQAVAVAQQADVVLAFVGLSPTLEGEEKPIHIDGFAGGDRTDIAMPAPQRKLLEAIAATGKPVVVVLMNGGAVAADWSKAHAQAILEAWYPGQAGAQAIAETLAGANNPGGRLPVTVYASVDQLLPFDDYSMANRTYRYFRGQPLFRFGDGLSYTRFCYSAVQLSTHTLHAGDSLTAEADVTNCGDRAGDEVAELYIAPPALPFAPRLSLQGFQRVHLSPGEERHLSFTLTPRQLSLVAADGARAVQPGEYTLSLGGSQPDADATHEARFKIVGTEPLPR